MGECVSKQEFSTFNEMYHDDNLRFYKNQLRARPSGDTFIEMLKWKGDYTMLEAMHGHIQWLFPIPGSSGTNECAKPLLDHEAQAIRKSEKLKSRVRAAYTMMLDFYGMELVNVDTGEVKRAKHWKTRYGYLNSSGRDWYRISRILTSLGELGFEHFQAPLVEFIIYEAATHRVLPAIHMKSVEHWIGIIKDELKQGELFRLLADLNGQMEGANAGIFKDAKSNTGNNTQPYEGEANGNCINNLEANKETNTTSYKITGDIEPEKPGAIVKDKVNIETHRNKDHEKTRGEQSDKTGVIVKDRVNNELHTNRNKDPEKTGDKKSDKAGALVKDRGNNEPHPHRNKDPEKTGDAKFDKAGAIAKDTVDNEPHTHRNKDPEKTRSTNLSTTFNIIEGSEVPETEDNILTKELKPAENGDGVDVSKNNKTNKTEDRKPTKTPSERDESGDDIKSSRNNKSKRTEDPVPSGENDNPFDSVEYSRTVKAKNETIDREASVVTENEAVENAIGTSVDDVVEETFGRKDMGASGVSSPKYVEIFFGNDPKLKDNVKFYSNKMMSRPVIGGAKIEEMLKWKGDYVKLERSHNYIQWLFPTPEESGINRSAQALQMHEAKTICESTDLRIRVLKAFKMMLDFYGMELVNDRTGDMKRGKHWEERYAHLNRSVHNRYRITRILKSIGELGFTHLQAPWVKFIILEATMHQGLPSLNGSSMNHWIDAIKDKAQQGELYHLFMDCNELMRMTPDRQSKQHATSKENSKPPSGAQKQGKNDKTGSSKTKGKKWHDF